jgi:hypothetical protein
VSPSWRERFTAVLAPDRVVLARHPRGWGRAPELQAECPCAGASPEAAVQALQDLLLSGKAGSGELTVLLSNHFVQYVLVPWRAELRSPAELAAYAAICFDETFGANPAGREILVAPERASSARLAAGIDNSLLHALRSALASSSLRLVSIRPYLPAAFDRVRRSLGSRDFLFLLAEPARSCVLVASGGRWRSLRNTSTAAQPHELANLIRREAQIAGLADEGMPPVFVHAPGRDDLQVPDCHGVTPRTLSLPRSAADPLLAMAMSVN